MIDHLNEKEVREGLAGAMDILRMIENPDEYEPGHIPELRKILVALVIRVISLGNLANEIDANRRAVQEFFDEGNMGLAASMAITDMANARNRLREIEMGMVGKVRVDLGNLDDRQSEPDGPVAESSDGYKVTEMEER